MGPKTTKAVAILEQLVDEVGLQTALDALTIVCNEKAAHVDQNWQDEHLSRNWSEMGGNMAEAAAQAGRRGFK